MRYWAHLQCIPVFLPTFLWFDFLVALRANHDLHGLWAVVLDVVLIGVLYFYHTTHCALQTHLLPHRITPFLLINNTIIPLQFENCWKCIQKSLILGFNSPVRPYSWSLSATTQKMTSFISFSTHPTEQCSNLAPKIYLCYVSWSRRSQLFTVLTGVIFQSLKLTVPGMEIISTRAELKEHSILDHLATSDLQIITSTGRSWSKFEPLL